MDRGGGSRAKGETEGAGEMDGLMSPEGAGAGKAQYPAGGLAGRGRTEGVS